MCQQILLLHASLPSVLVNDSFEVLANTFLYWMYASQYLHDDYDNKVIIQYHFPFFVSLPF